jgi:insulysin
MLRAVTIISLLLIASCATRVAGPVPVEIIKSPNDDREYRYLELPNQLKIVLVSDPTSDKAAAALTVFRGSLHDPKEHPGLAHFLEHMLFIGTAKYPDVDGYQHFLTANGGSSNAYTASDHTNYFFDVAPPQFPEALDRFADFFISPLFTAEYVDREKNAVHSEYQLQIKDDAWRGMTAGKLMMNPAHPLAAFNIGSLETLDGDVRTALLKFFADHYSADQMALVVLAPDSLDVLQTLVTERFSPIPNHNLGRDDTPVQVFTQDNLPVRLDVKPIQELRSVTYSFPVPALRPHYRAKPEFYIANLLGHEGKGSLYATLKALGWATGLSSTSGDLDTDESNFEVSVSLTEEGAKHIDEITSYLFAYIDLIRKEEPLEWRQKELVLLGDLGFRFMEKGGALRTVYALAPALMNYPAEEILRYRYRYDEFKPELIRNFMDRLRPDNVAVQVTLPNVVTNARERWFGVDYALTRGPIRMATLPAAALADLSLPEANPFLPEDLALVKSEPSARHIINDGTVDYWLHTDGEFGIPKANLRFNLNVDGGLVTAEDQAAARLFANLVADATNQWAYATLLAGMNAQIGSRPLGFRFDITGYNDKQLVLVERVLETFATMPIDPARFAIIKRDLIQSLDNSNKERPYLQTMEAVGQAVHGTEWPEVEISRAVAAITPARLDAWRKAHLAKVGFFGLAHGNVTEDDARGVLKAVGKYFKLSATDTELPGPVQIHKPQSIELPIEHGDASLVAFLQEPDRTLRSKALAQLSAQLIQQGFFTSLRTEQQLGYVVGMGARAIDRQPGLLLTVQSPVASPDQILKAMQDYLDAQPAVLTSMSDEEFNAKRQGLLVKLLEADKNLGQRTERYWTDLDDDITTFDGNRQLAAAVEALTREEVQVYVSDLPRRLKAQSIIAFSRGAFAPLAKHGERSPSVTVFKQRYGKG